jgi:2-polyprenyl-3-methyl-5-hydroxy-6-metoxy-1,4-benzoquinol methylase
MPLQDEETPSSAGISSSENGDGEVDVAALFAQLKEEVRHAGGLDLTDAYDRGIVRSRLRAVAERYWPVTAERPLDAQPGPKGAAKHFLKRVLRKGMRWYVQPFAAEQRAFNDAALKLVDQLAEEVDALFRRLERADVELGAQRDDAARARSLVGEVEERLTRLERRDRTAGDGVARPVTVAAQPAAANLPDYFAFESKMRGSTDEIARRQAAYVEDFRDAAPVLDVGCGRGELLQLLHDAGIEASGVDADADMVDFARGAGLDVHQADLVAHLESLDDGSLGGLFAGQVVEHLPAPALVRFLELAHAKLRDGGKLVAETINPLSPLALRNYFADLTHAQPLVPETLALLARQVGFADAEIRYLNAPPTEQRLRAVELPDELGAAREALAHNVARLNDTLFGPLDYAVVARR